MLRGKSAAYMSAGEQIAGTVLFVIYLLVLPLSPRPCSAWWADCWG